MDHKIKVKLANKLRTLEEKKEGVALFSSKKWKKRKVLQAKKHEKLIEGAKARAAARKLKS